jgi:hypothetical protein
MAVVVVGGGARGVGKTTLVCGVICALPEFAWIAVKVTTHAHSGLAPVYEEIVNREAGGERSGGWIPAAGREADTDTARYLAAGARRAFLVSASDAEFEERLRALQARVGPDANLIFESNRMLRHLRADVCLAVRADGLEKPSFALVEIAKQATVRRAAASGGDEIMPGAETVFQLAEFARISEPMRTWLCARLG